MWHVSQLLSKVERQDFLPQGEDEEFTQSNSAKHDADAKSAQAKDSCIRLRPIGNLNNRWPARAVHPSKDGAGKGLQWHF
jgi:hypothetical protein